MATDRHGPVHWYRPDPRAVFPLQPPDAFHVSRSLKKRIAQKPFVITFDQAFESVMRGCAEPRKEEKETWISEEIIVAYTRLFEAGLAHSVEAWLPPQPPALPGDYGDMHRRGELVGGVYGLSLGGAFFGESMFSRATDASKICLVHLVEHLRTRGYELFDVQLTNPHLEQFGVVEISCEQYLQQLEHAVQLPAMW